MKERVLVRQVGEASGGEEPDSKRIIYMFYYNTKFVAKDLRDKTVPSHKKLLGDETLIFVA